MNRTRIEWCTWTWNPVEGCSRASEGCDRCYAAAMARRFHRPWGSAVFHPDRLDQPARRARERERTSASPRDIVFCCSTSDLWHPSVRHEWRLAVFAQFVVFHALDFVILTKRPERIARWAIHPPNVLIGISAENQARYLDRWAELCCRVPRLGRCPGGMRIVSFEPMLGPVDILHQPHLPDWVIAGPETGPGARPCDPAWLDDLADQCARASVPFFDKSSSPRRQEFPP